MAGQKIKFRELMGSDTKFVQRALDEAKRDKNGEITEAEMEKVEKLVLESILQNVEKSMRHNLKHGNSIEFPGMMNISKVASSVYLNGHGKPKERLTIRTRAAYLRHLNNEL